MLVEILDEGIKGERLLDLWVGEVIDREGVLESDAL